MVNKSVVTPGNWLRSLGYPIGNNFDIYTFLDAIYSKAKKSLITAHNVSTTRINGRHKYLNACFYGRFRFYLWGIEFPEEYNKRITSDARAFLWRINPNLDIAEKGTKASIHTFVSKNAEARPWKKGGAAIMNWNIHHKNFYVQWVLKLFHPRLALWTKIIDVWLDMPRHIIIDKISKTKQKEILSKIPNGASYFKRCLKEFWELEF